MLTDCVSKDKAVCELFIVQSGQVSELARCARNRITQAVLAIDKSIVRAHGTGLEEVLDDDQFKWIIAAFGIGVELPSSRGSADVLRLDHLRYGKIIVAMDRSSEGKYIRNQVLGLLRKYFYPILGAGHVYTCIIDGVALSSESSTGTV
jgi:DNA gyrase subunit B